jgi:putative ABC transport system permease protein
MRIGLRLYRLLLKLFPAGFRESYGAPMERQFQDDYSDVRGGRARFRFWLDTVADVVRAAPGQLAREVGQDARHALRMWMKRPLHTAFAVLVLAVAIGANTGVFSVVNGLLLRSLPFHDPERLAFLRNFAAPREEFHTWRTSTPYLSDAAMFATFDVNVEGVNRAGRVRLTETSWNFFSVLGRAPLRGRPFLQGEDVPGRNAIAVLGFGMWQQLFGSDPGAIGATIRVNGTPLTIVGIAPPDFDYPQGTGLWSPTAFDFPRVPKTGSAFFWYNIGRLKSGLSWTQARQAFEAEAFRRSPEDRTADAVNRPALLRLQDALVGPVGDASLILLASVGLLLLLACANLANLLLARTVARSTELAIRRALGASRARLTQQLLTEALLLSLVATAAAIVVAWWMAGFAASVQPVPLSTQAYTVLDWRVLGFAAGVAALTALVFGAGPALYASRATFTPSGRSATPGRGPTQLRRALVMAQVALAIVLLTGSMGLGRAFLALLRVDNGYDLASVATAHVSFAGTRHQGGERARAYYDDAARRLQALPGVRSVAMTESLPLATDAFMGTGFRVDNSSAAPFATLVLVGPGYFRTIGSALVAGREFTRDDVVDNQPVAMVSDEFARAFGSPAALIGRSLTGEGVPRRIVGVVRGMRYGGPVYAPSAQVFWPSRAPRAMTVVVRVDGPARQHLALVRDTIQAVDPAVPVFDMMTMEQRLDGVLARPKFYATSVLMFGGLALLLAIIGVYGVVSYAVIQRTREMGIRLALGSTPVRLRTALVGRMSITLAAGGLAGILLAAAFGRYLQAMVHGASAETLGTSTLAVAITASVGAAAAWLATHRIARLDIADVLRVESAD